MNAYGRIWASPGRSPGALSRFSLARNSAPGSSPWTRGKTVAIFHLSTRGGAAHSGAAPKHAVYIERVGKYAERDDLVVCDAGNMPEWAQNDPQTFWLAADQNERANGRAYREIEIAIPRELSHDQAEGLVRGFIAEQLPGHAWEMALHDKRDGNPHAHIMFSERVQDGIERDRESYFKRANTKNPAKGGCRKDDGWRGTRKNPPPRLLEVRAAWAEHCNRALALAGVEAQVDHRSLEAQGVDRLPQIHVGPENPRGLSGREERAEKNQAIQEANRARGEVDLAREEMRRASEALREASRQLREERKRPVPSLSQNPPSQKDPSPSVPSLDDLARAAEKARAEAEAATKARKAAQAAEREAERRAAGEEGKFDPGAARRAVQTRKAATSAVATEAQAVQKSRQKALECAERAIDAHRVAGTPESQQKATEALAMVARAHGETDTAGRLLAGKKPIGAGEDAWKRLREAWDRMLMRLRKELGIGIGPQR